MIIDQLNYFLFRKMFSVYSICKQTNNLKYLSKNVFSKLTIQVYRKVQSDNA